jgi:hypothetical protein
MTKFALTIAMLALPALFAQASANVDALLKKLETGASKKNQVNLGPESFSLAEGLVEGVDAKEMKKMQGMIVRNFEYKSDVAMKSHAATLKALRDAHSGCSSIVDVTDDDEQVNVYNCGSTGQGMVILAVERNEINYVAIRGSFNLGELMKIASKMAKGNGSEKQVK